MSKGCHTAALKAMLRSRAAGQHARHTSHCCEPRTLSDIYNTSKERRMCDGVQVCFTHMRR